MGFEILARYSQATGQISGDIPIYFAADKDGSLTGGVRASCSSDGKTDQGFVIKGNCTAAIFIGTRFRLFSN